jgi:hypothetical protein
MFITHQLYIKNIRFLTLFFCVVKSYLVKFQFPQSRLILLIENGYMILDVGLILAAHRLEVAADGPQLHRRVLRPWANVITLFFFVTDEETKLKRFFFLGEPFQPLG